MLLFGFYWRILDIQRLSERLKNSKENLFNSCFFSDHVWSKIIFLAIRSYLCKIITYFYPDFTDAYRIYKNIQKNSSARLEHMFVWILHILYMIELLKWFKISTFFHLVYIYVRIYWELLSGFYGCTLYMLISWNESKLPN